MVSSRKRRQNPQKTEDDEGGKKEEKASKASKKGDFDENLRISLEKYPETLKKNKKEELFALDEWYRNELRTTVLSRKPPSLNSDELIKVVKWKITRGKFRPLINLVRQNEEEKVRQITAEAFDILVKLPLLHVCVEKEEKLRKSCVSAIIKAIKCLSNMKGVGPATASALAAVVRSDVVPFMSDEGLLAFKSLGAIAYTLPHYEKYLVEVLAMMERLNASKREPLTEEDLWTAEEVEKALWASSKVYSGDNSKNDRKVKA